MRQGRSRMQVDTGFLGFMGNPVGFWAGLGLKGCVPGWVCRGLAMDKCYTFGCSRVASTLLKVSFKGLIGYGLTTFLVAESCAIGALLMDPLLMRYRASRDRFTLLY